MIIDSLIIMLIGMAVVFVFLVVMIFVMNLTGKVLNSKTFQKLFPTEEVVPTAVPQQTNSSELEEIAAAIAIAKANA